MKVTSYPRTGVLDLRLVPAAVVTWAVTLAGLLGGWGVAAALAIAAVVLLPTVRARRIRRWRNGLLAVLVLAGITATGVGVRAHSTAVHPLHLAAQQGDRVEVRASLTSRPKPLRGASYGARRAQDRSVVQVRLRSVHVDGRRTAVGGRALLLVPTEPWRSLIAGQEVTATGRAVPPRGGELLTAAVQVGRAPERVRPPPGWQRIAEGLREGLRSTSRTVLGPEAAGLLPGLVVGDTGLLPPEVVEQFETSGLTHLMAVSGANLAIVCGAVLLVLRLVVAGPVPCALGAGAAMAGFVVLAGPEPSVLRAAVMGAITLFALALGRERSALPTLAGSVIGLLLLAPGLATTAGFALSVAATAGLVLLAPGWSAALHARGVPVGLAEALAVPAAAHLVTAPLVAAISGQVSLVAVVANLLAGPLVAPATVLGVAATVVAPWCAPLAGALVWLAGPELEWLLAVARHSAAVPGAAVDWPSGVVGGTSLAVLALVLLIVLRGRIARLVLTSLVLVVVVVVIPVRHQVFPWPVPGWSLVACDVGQGDGLVLATGRDREAVVVDTGPDPAPMAECLRRLRIRSVPLVLLTHLHADHVGGISAVLSGRQVGAVAVGPLGEPAWAAREVRATARAHRTPVVPLRAGQRLRWPGLVLDVLGPRGALARSNSAEDANDASLVVKATTPAGRVLLTGDVALPGQAALLASGADLRAEVLKVPHHGSRFTTPRLLARVRPQLAVISVGAGNDYGHPSPLILGELQRMGARIHRTDQAGDIAVVPEGRGRTAVERGDPLRPDER
ncbi:ComEC/Rec2 family competence protein [Saccharopolyspora sp. 6T]|uniref:ComEC/Rec2 family competence protein n=2 Tax=unclassified Saccharopolyspora TaxID=2646250 RepID=UPI001CD3D49D|nr:ComEC/Rec2 family competence protein [Saccharopolyspora sp. 6T]MCA1189189.1 ComEC/Rec2 family competence protein [Saccharopolyspora sp. 6T]